jgi:hypothetical protein
MAGEIVAYDPAFPGHCVLSGILDLSSKAQILSTMVEWNFVGGESEHGNQTDWLRFQFPCLKWGE